MLDEVGRLTVDDWGNEKCMKCFKRRLNKKSEVRKQKF